jgi:hypothetical protein
LGAAAVFDVVAAVFDVVAAVFDVVAAAFSHCFSSRVATFERSELRPQRGQLLPKTCLEIVGLHVLEPPEAPHPARLIRLRLHLVEVGHHVAVLCRDVGATRRVAWKISRCPRRSKNNTLLGCSLDERERNATHLGGLLLKSGAHSRAASRGKSADALHLEEAKTTHC